MTTPTTRIHGLDTLRALAIVLVVLHHYVLFVTDAPTFGWVGEIGWVGVDLFFALSGYLIGNQIVAAVRSPGGLSLGRFYARRFLRTLPGFYVVLALYFLWPGFRGDAPLLPLWKYLSFTQNYQLEPGTAFSHAWSLSIEEQFYLVLPAVVLAVAATARSMRLAWCLVGAAFAAGMLYRGLTWLDVVQGEPAWRHHYFKYIYYSSFARCDELLAGVALALVRHYHGNAWAALLRHGRLLLAAGVGVTGLAWWLFLQDHFGLAMTVLGYPLLAFGFVLLVAAAVAPSSPLCRWRVPGAGPLALWSYALYLTHKQVCILLGEWATAAGLDVASPPVIVALLAAALLSGWLLYRLVEAPCMALRARYLPGNGRPLPREGRLQPSTTP